MLNENEIVYLDLETTGLDPSDEILEIGILSNDGTVLLDTYVKPIHHTVWHKAQQINGISPDDVKDAPLLEEIKPKIIEYVKGKTVVIYNASFDYQFLETELELAKDTECCMLKFAPVYGDWHDYWENYTWQSLETAAKYVFFKWEEEAHSAIGDCKATRAVWHYLTIDTEKKRIDAIKQAEKEKQEIEWEVDNYLRQLKYDQEREQEKFLEKVNNFWTLRILGKELPMRCSICKNNVRMSPIRQGNEREKWEELEEMYHLLFTGYSKKIWKEVFWWENSGLPLYQKRKDIPEHLLIFSKLDAVDWILGEMRPVACYLSSSGKTFNDLYDVNDIEKIRKTKPNRYESWENVPEDLKSKTKLKREHKIDVEKEGLKPVADVRMYTPYGIEYVPLYQVPKNTPKTRKKTNKKTNKKQKTT